MDALWPDRLSLGDQVRFDGQVCTVTGVCGGRVALLDNLGATEHVDVVSLLASEDFAFLGQGTGPPEQSAPPLPEAALERVHWWRQHVTEVMTGVPHDAPPGTKPLPAYDPSRHTLAEREEAKARELADLGVRGASSRTVQRKRQRYQQQGLAGLADGRAGRYVTDEAQLDPRVRTTVWEVLATQRPGDPPTARHLHDQVLARLAGPIAAGELPRPSRAAVRRLAVEMLVSEGKTRLRRGNDVAVGERVHLDTVELPLPSGGADPKERLRLLVALDEATRLVLAAVVHNGHRPPLHTTLLARMCSPPDVYDDWGAVLSGRLHGTERRHTSSLIVRPASLVADESNAPGLRTLREACAQLGIHVRYAQRVRPTDRQAVERTLDHFASLFTDHLLSTSGRAAHEAGWPLEMVQDLLDAWVTRIWPDAPVPTSPAGGTHTPRTRHETLTASAGWTPTPFPPQVFPALLNVSWRVVGPQGLRLGGHTYNAPALDPLRSSVSPSGGRRSFEVRWDPYDLRRVWLRSADDEWITVTAISPAARPAIQTILHHAPLEHTEVYAATARRQPDTAADESAPGPVSWAMPSCRDWAVSPFSDLETCSRAVPDHVRVAYHARLPLRVPGVVSAAQRIEELLDLNRYGAGARHGVLLHGVSGTGKTTALLEAARRYTAQLPGSPSEEPGDSSMPVIYVRLPPATSPRLLLAELARSLGIPLRGSPTTADLAVRVSEAMAAAHTSLVLIDEIQQLRSPGWSDTAVAETLDYLCDRIPATFVFAGIGSPTSLATTVTYTPHRRLLSVRLDLVPEGEIWQDVISRAEHALRLHAHEPGTLTAQASLLHQRTGGNVGQLALLLRAGAVRAIHEGTEQLTISLLCELPLPRRE
ncbi:AAA family ATPase [Streptomyces olivochromogenes]|uniref:AAA family ATPase n=1 Tax=Streptomyces olivochromogenes TaxID=1963 RepID=UPI001F30216B|nr:AAA family ATPase [Streptomyces olivochromogenes]MCF3129097.1 AAA family ATPase [Streptomyces olivochromogenes]